MYDADRTIVHIDRVTKRFGATVAVDALDMQIRAGEFVTFLGPSGCGKSTTLRILGGFERPDEGRVILSGEDVTDLPPNRRRVNMVFQDYALFPHMTVAQNIAFGLELKRMPRAEIAAKVKELLEFLQLGAFGDRRPDQLSGGQRQRVALARALAPEPDLLLLDEPLGALDAKLRAQVQVELKEIQRRTGKTFFFVTHDQDEALTMSDRIVVMDAGRVQQVGTPEDLYLRPQNRFVAGFIGETNLIEGTAKGAEAGRLAVDWQGETLHVAPDDRAPRAGEAVTLAIRPEKLRLSAERPAEGPALAGRIASRVFKGNRTVVTVRLDASGAVLRASADPEAVAGDEGAAVWVHWSDQHLALLRD